MIPEILQKATDELTRINIIEEAWEYMKKVQIETIKTESFKMNYFKFGHGKEVFVILPGLSLQSVMNFADMVVEAYQILADNFTVYVFDRRKELPANYSVEMMAQDTVKAFRALDLNWINLFGASQGGMIAMRIAIDQPKLVQKLILGSTSACVEEAQYKTVEKWVQMARSRKKTELCLAMGEALYPKHVFEQSQGLLAETAKSVTDADLHRFIILAESLNGFDTTMDLEKIACPVFVIGSKDDRVLGADATVRITEYLHKRKEFAFYMYDGYGHAAYDTAPDYKERILHFLIE